MPIPNITRTNTVDEWRIQTNLSANALNRLETGYYDKTAGSLNIACTAVISITSTGTGLSVANNALVSGDFTVGKSIALGSEGAATGNLTVGANTYIYGRGAALFVANSAIVNVSIQATQSIRTNTFIANTDASITGTAQIGYLAVNNYATVGTTLDVVGNTTVGNLATANSIVGDSLRIFSDAGIGGTLRVTGNSVFGNVNTAGMVYAGSLRTVHRADVGTTLDVVGNTTVGNLVTSNSVVADNGRFTNNVIVGHIVANSGSTVADSLRITNSAGIGGTLRVTGNSVFGNVNTAGMVYAATARTTGRADVGGDFTVGGEAFVQGKLTVSGDFVLSGDIVYDTDVLTISTITPIANIGAAYFGVFRGNTSGGVIGANVNALGTISDANAYIRWVASSNTWQIRDVFNADNSTSYSKILTANLISSSLTSTSTDTFLSSSGAKSLKDSIDTEITDRQANVGASRIAVTNAYQANVGAGLITVTNAYQANVGAGRIADQASAQANTGAARIDAVTANTNMKNYVDTRTTTNIAEGTNLYFTDTRARAAVGTAATFATPLNYITSNGTFQHLNSGVSAGNYGGATTVPVFSVNATGHLSYAGNVAIAIAAGAVSGLATSATTDTTNATNITSGTLSAVRLPAFSGDITTSAGSSSTTLTTVNATTGTFGDASTVAIHTVNAKGLVTYTANVPIAISSGAVSGLASSATTDTTNASNISSGTLSAARLGTTGAPRFGSLGVGTAASGTTGEILATGDITAYYSDDRLKTREDNIDNALQKVLSLNGFYYRPNEIAQELGYENKKQVGVSAQEVQKVMPEVVAPAPIDEKYLTVHYQKLVPLLIEAIKELKYEIEELKKK